MAVILSVSCSWELREELKDRQISPSKAFQAGAYQLLGKIKPDEITSVDEDTEKTKRIRLQTTMQRTINELNEELEEVRRKDGMALE